jgi:hypothetical protein
LNDPKRPGRAPIGCFLGETKEVYDLAMTDLVLLPPSTYRRVPWKNGGGMTSEIARRPVGGEDAEGYRWRLSIADVAAEGPFSAFPGLERLIAVIDGAGMTLAIDGRAPVSVRNGDPALGFSGDSAVDCRLLAGPIRDFNLIFDPASVDGRMDWLGPEQPLQFDGGDVLIHVIAGSGAIEADGGRLVVGPGSTGWSAGHRGSLSASPDGRAIVARARSR